MQILCYVFVVLVVCFLLATYNFHTWVADTYVKDVIENRKRKLEDEMEEGFRRALREELVQIAVKRRKVIVVEDSQVRAL